MPIRGDPDSLSVGHHVDAVEDIRSILRQAAADRFDFVSIPLAAPQGQGVDYDFRPSVESCLTLEGEQWRTVVVGRVSESLDPDTASTFSEAEVLRSCLETELRWAAHLGLQYAILPPPHSALDKGATGSGCSYARAVGDLLAGGLFSLAALEDAAPVALQVPATSSGWKAWNRFRTLCDHHVRLCCALELTVDKTSEKELERWLAEPVRCVILSPSTFLLNRSGYPVLPKKAKALLEQLFRRQVQVIIAEPQSVEQNEGLLPRLSYIARLFQALPPLSQAERFAYSHMDTLQAPLQPLADNLESETYELFETDPVKYAKYQEAVFIFLTERKQEGRPMPFCVMVLGAGRGPLVEAALKAAERAEVEVDLYAVEKNPNAVQALRHRKRRDGWSSVQVVPGDMRSWDAPKKADVIISELLGSFGDNELSPECLDGAQRFLASDGVCIPISYTAALTPVTAPGLWANARQGAAGGGVADLETAYVVHMQHAFYPCSAVKDCFEFHHPNWTMESNDRCVDLDFEIEVDSLVHGFAGYFDCVLYGPEHISIHPKNFSAFIWASSSQV
ncbi:Protein arginine N-methyltransferase 5 (Shk1 kinase-binding protein 1 homolog) [Durusdinium trenchii]|uniref:Protein arginine N-methyltransferase n=1 Tax=Durusdinium trenchii TaxID=1381693 RepID=A0ABP0RK44_9DINO